MRPPNTSSSPQVVVRVLGPTRLVVDRREVRLSPLRRRVVAALALTRDVGVSADELIDLVWQDRAPSAARPSLLNQLSWLRRRLPDRTLLRAAGRYQFDAQVVAYDLDRLLAIRDELGVDGGACAASVLAVTEDLPTGWSEPAYADLSGRHPALDAARRQALALRRQLEARRAEALLAVGRGVDAVGLLEQLVREDPADEHGWARLMLALADSGRRIEALEVYRQARRRFVDEHGLDVPELLEHLQRRVLKQRGAAMLSQPTAHLVAPR